MIHLKNIRKSWGAFSLSLDSLEIPDGEYGVCVGPSGAGKSLMLKLIAGLYSPSRGSVVLGEEDVTEVAPENRRVGLVFQESSLFPHFSVRGNIEYGLRARAVPKKEIDERFSRVTESLKLGGVLDRPVRTLSGGEAQKVALARAIVMDPKVLLLDEPLSQVDRYARGDLVETLKDLNKDQGLTCLHVTHDSEEALALGTWFAVLMGGRVLQAGSRDEVLSNLFCPFAARLLGQGADKTEKPEGCDERCLLGTGACSVLMGGEYQHG